MAANGFPGFRVRRRIERPSPELVAGLKDVCTGNVCDAMDRFGALDHRIKPLSPAMRCTGSALTVRTRPGDNLMVYKGLETAQAGDVLVIATYEYTTTSVLGELVCMMARARGLAGIVTDGMVRDVAGILDVGLPVFARGATPNSPYKDGPGEVNGSISCGGVAIHPGDIIVGDGDGVVVVPREDAARVLQRLVAVREKEATMLANIQAGRLIPDFIEETLRAKGCEYVD